MSLAAEIETHRLFSASLASFTNCNFHARQLFTSFRHNAQRHGDSFCDHDDEVRANAVHLRTVERENCRRALRAIERRRRNEENKTQPRPPTLSFSFSSSPNRGSTAVAAAAPAAATPAAPLAATTDNSRRTLLASLAGTALFALSSPALPSASAAIGVWDGTAASGSCAVGVEGDACRARTLAKDFGKKASGEEGYGESIKASSGLNTNTNSIPIPSMQGAYASETRALSEAIREYLALAPSDASRVPKGKAVRKAGAVWAAKYAPGGSARLKSAR